jgi:uncharacterized delta-60 repeat protein
MEKSSLWATFAKARRQVISRFLVARHDPNGGLDISFGDGGKVITNFIAGPSSANALALQSDGKIVVAGRAGDQFALARYNSDGTLDQNFDSGGLISASFEPGNANTISLASSLAIQPDGKIVVGGDSFNRNPAAPDYVLDSNVALARYNSDGTLDGTFGAGGFVVSSFGNFDRTDAITIQSDGKIIVAGDSNSTGLGLYDYTLTLVRYNPNGTPDETFGAAGRAVPVSGSFDVSALALRQDGKIVVAGTYLSPYPANKDFALTQYNGDGTLNSSFGIAGLGVTDFAWTGSATGRENVTATLAVQADGKILVGGYSASNFALARYNNDASPDTAFGAEGIGITQVGSLGLSTFNFPVAASSTFGSALSLSGSFFTDSSFVCCSPAGVKFQLFLIEQAFALAIQPNGKIIAGGVLDNQAALVRFHSITTPRITVANAGAGLGGIWSPDGAISCGTRCSASYDAGSTVLLGWATAFGSYFSGWNGYTPIAGGGCRLTLNADTIVTAEFDLDLAIATDAAPLPDGAVGMTYMVQVGLTGGQHPFSSRVTSGALPSGLALNGRMLSGTPLRSGRSKFTVEFTDSTGFPIKKSFNLTVLKSLSLSTQSLKAGRLGRSYSAALKAKGGGGPYDWSLVSGNLPTGFSLDSATGRITGLPTVTGSYSLTIRLSDATGQRIDRSLTLIIN